FWELTNLGTSIINLFTGTTAWSWSDSDSGSHGPGEVTIPLGTSIAPNESIVFLAGGNTDVTTFKTDWGIGSSVQVFGDAASPGFGQNDGVYLYDDTGAIVTSFLYGAGGFTLSSGGPSTGGHAGLSAGGTSNNQSAIWDPTSGSESPRYTFADGSDFGSYAAPTGNGTGSPGFAVEPAPEPSTLALAGFGLAAFWQFRRRR
ncbi:MAG: PEP-CTERM sorting domain-containing protein, partial [Verrucomicrobiota bacterium]